MLTRRSESKIRTGEITTSICSIDGNWILKCLKVSIFIIHVVSKCLTVDNRCIEVFVQSSFHTIISSSVPDENRFYLYIFQWWLSLIFYHNMHMQTSISLSQLCNVTPQSAALKRVYRTRWLFQQRSLFDRVHLCQLMSPSGTALFFCDENFLSICLAL